MRKFYNYLFFWFSVFTFHVDSQTKLGSNDFLERFSNADYKCPTMFNLIVAKIVTTFEERGKYEGLIMVILEEIEILEN